MPVTQTTEEQAVGAQEESQAAAADGGAFDAAVTEFLSYLQGYRQYSSWTVGAYGIDLREFRQFLLEQVGRVPAPDEITRPQVVAWGLSLKSMKPLTIRRKYGCLSSFFGFLQDMGRCHSNPARNLPLPSRVIAVASLRRKPADINRRSRTRSRGFLAAASSV